MDNAMVEYGFFVLLYLATLVAPSNQNKIQLVLEKNGKKETLYLERLPRKTAMGEEHWEIGIAGETQKEKVLVNKNKHEIMLLSMSEEPIRVSEFLKVPKNYGKAKAFLPSDAMLKEKHTPVTLKRGTKNVELQQSKGWLENYKTVKVTW